MSKGVDCIEFTGGNVLKPLDGIAKTPEPPEGFVDNTVYRYKLMPDGTKKFLGTMEPFIEGWDEPRHVKQARAKRRKEDELMAIDWKSLDAKLLELHGKGLSFKQIGEAIGVSTSATHKRFHELQKMQAKEPATEPTAKSETVEEETQPAEESIADSLTNDEPIPYVVNGLDFEKELAPENILTDLIINRSRDKVIDVLEDPIATVIIKELVRQDVI